MSLWEDIVNANAVNPWLPTGMIASAIRPFLGSGQERPPAPPGQTAMDRLYQRTYPNPSDMPPEAYKTGGDLSPSSLGSGLTDLASLVAPYLAGGAPAGSMSSGMRAPSLISPRATFFDYSDLSRVPDVPQTALSREGIGWAKGTPERWQQLAENPETFKNYREAAEAGMPEGRMGGREWYNTHPLYRAWMDSGGSEEGFRRYIDYVGASSPENKVPQNIKSASMFYNLDRQGQPFPEVYGTGKSASIYPPEVKKLLFPKDAAGNDIPTSLSPADEAALRDQYGLPTGYGAKSQKTWIPMANAIREGRGFDLAANPKPPSFTQNLLGNYQPVTIDRHNMRLIAPWAGDTPGSAYPFLEGLQQDYASKLNIAPAQAQAATWLGGNTGVKSSLTKPFVGEFEDKLNAAARRNNLSPQDMFRHFVLGDLPL